MRARIATLAALTLAAIAVAFAVWSAEWGWTPGFTLDNGDQWDNTSADADPPADISLRLPDNRANAEPASNDAGEAPDYTPTGVDGGEVPPDANEVLRQLGDYLASPPEELSSAQHASFFESVFNDTSYGEAVLHTFLSGEELNQQAANRLDHGLLEFAVVAPQSITLLFNLALDLDTEGSLRDRALRALRVVRLHTAAHTEAYLDGVQRTSLLDPQTYFEPVAVVCMFRLVKHQLMHSAQLVENDKAASRAFQEIVNVIDEDAGASQETYSRATTNSAATAIKDPYQKRLRQRLGLACSVVQAGNSELPLRELLSEYLWTRASFQRGVPGSRALEFPKGTHLEQDVLPKVNEQIIESVVAACAKVGTAEILVNYIVDDRRAWMGFGTEKQSMTETEAKEYAKGFGITFFTYMKWPRDHGLALALIDKLDWLSQAEATGLVSIYDKAITNRENWRRGEPVPELVDDVAEFTQRTRSQPNVPEWLLSELDKLEAKLK